MVLPRRQDAAAGVIDGSPSLPGGASARRRAVVRQSAESRDRAPVHHDVDVMLLDEPTRGIDVGSKAQIYALLARSWRNAKNGPEPFCSSAAICPSCWVCAIGSR